MSRYIGYTGQAIIKEEYREDFLNLYHGKFSRMKTEIMRKYVRRYGYAMLNLKSWNHAMYNDGWEEILPTEYDEKTGLFSYGVTLNYHHTDLFYCIDFFIYVLMQIADEAIPYKVWDEYGKLTREDIESMRDPRDLDMIGVEDIEIEDMED